LSKNAKEIWKYLISQNLCYSFYYYRIFCSQTLETSLFFALMSRMFIAKKFCTFGSKKNIYIIFVLQLKAFYSHFSWNFSTFPHFSSFFGLLSACRFVWLKFFLVLNKFLISKLPAWAFRRLSKQPRLLLDSSICLASIP